MFRQAGLREILSAADRLVGRGPVEALTAELARARSRVLELACDRLGNRIAAKALTVKVLNLLLAKHELRMRAVAPLSRPFGLTLDPANGCTLHCPGCVHSVRAVEGGLFDWPAGMLTEPMLSRLLRGYGPYAVQTMFCNYGEPLLNPGTPGFIAMARRYLMQTMLSTSLCVRRFDAEAYVRSGLDYMVLSIDGATQAVYSQYRRNGSLDLVLENLKALVEARKRLDSATPVLGWQFLAFEHNVHEVEAAIALARELGVDEFKVTPPFDVSWDDPSIRPAGIAAREIKLNPHPERALLQNWRRFSANLDEEAIEEAYAREWGPGGLEGGAGPSCRWLYKNLTMDARGRTFPCCGAPTPEGGLAFARVSDGGAEPYNSEQHRRARMFFARPAEYARSLPVLPGTPPPYCVRCEWVDMRADIDSAQVANYLRAAGAELFDRRCVHMLSEW